LATVDSIIHPIVPDKRYLSPFDPPNPPPPARRRQTAHKPGSVPSAAWPRRMEMAIPLGRPLPGASCDRPERRREGSPGIAGIAPDACRSYLVLLPVGFAVPPPLPAARCALTAPFHPCRPSGTPVRASRCTFCGTVPGVAPAGRYPAPHLRGARTFLSPLFGERPSGRLAAMHLGVRCRSVKPLRGRSPRPASHKGAAPRRRQRYRDHGRKMAAIGTHRMDGAGPKFRLGVSGRIAPKLAARAVGSAALSIWSQYV
jgi:hypothetical protein